VAEKESRQPAAAGRVLPSLVGPLDHYVGDVRENVEGSLELCTTRTIVPIATCAYTE